jgi:hypothetical protein
MNPVMCGELKNHQATGRFRGDWRALVGTLRKAAEEQDAAKLLRLVAEINRGKRKSAAAQASETSSRRSLDGGIEECRIKQSANAETLDW